MSHFNHVANEWDSEGKVQLMAKLAEETLAQLNLSGKKLDILDFGCGTGLFGLSFIDCANSLTGVDTSEGMLEVFNEKVKGLSHVKTHLLNLEKEDMVGSFDLIVSSMTFHHLVKPSSVLLKLSKLIREKGKMAIVDLVTEDGSFHPDPKAMGVHHYGFSSEEIQAWAEEVGCEVSITTINRVEKNGRNYDQFLAIFNKV